jgi:ATP-dependent helicase/nuclease subunit A
MVESASQPHVVPDHVATDPRYSCWVSASAGSGKTKILIDRILRLILAGFNPAGILCITFTRAAVAEMQERILEIAKKWLFLPDTELKAHLLILLNREASVDEIEKARQLYDTLARPGALSIQTIHSFSQSLLQAFPLEAGLSVGFQILDPEDVKKYMQHALDEVLSNPSGAIETVCRFVAQSMSKTRFEDYLLALYENKGQFQKILNQYGSLQAYGDVLKHFLELDGDTPYVDDAAALSLCAEIKPDIALKDFLFTKDGSPRKRILKKDEQALYPGALAVFEQVQTEMDVLLNYEKNAALFHKTMSLLALIHPVLERFEALKKEQARIDFDDFVTYATGLLRQSETMAWVNEKLDHVMEHILIDEAQDTSASQWEFIAQCVETFLTPENPQRTLFVVGDLKQSIYGFQGAQPDLFEAYEKHFKHWIEQIGGTWRKVDLERSFRSTPEVLDVVDRVFEKHPGGVVKKGLLKHQPKRLEHTGRVELWPLIDIEPHEIEEEPWPIPSAPIEIQNPHILHAQQIAQRVLQILHSKEVLPSTQKPVEPRDIFILMQRRSELMSHLTKALEDVHIPVNAQEKRLLTDYRAIQDLIALGHVLCNELNDYALACVLKSPLFDQAEGISEEALFECAHGRARTLFQSLQGYPAYEAFVDFLNQLRSQVDFKKPSELFEMVLRVKMESFCAIYGQGIAHLLHQFLDVLYDFEEKNAPSLFTALSYLEETPIYGKPSLNADGLTLMTIHGSKGLQAPIVILADATDQTLIKNDLWLSSENMLLCWPTQAQITPQLDEWVHYETEKSKNEHRRLLYVAMTRAQDHLFVTGLTKKKVDETWYGMIETVVGQVEPLDTALPPFEMEHPENTTLETPDWLLNPPQSYHLKKKEEAPVFDADLALRGEQMHKLFELYPTVIKTRTDVENWAAAHQFDVDSQDIDRFMEIVSHPHWQHFFGDKAKAEVEICSPQGLFRLDRLVVLEDEVHILDFKTSPHVPISVHEIPQHIARQMSHYGDLIQRMYPHLRVRLFILGAQTPQMIELSLVS